MHPRVSEALGILAASRRGRGAGAQGTERFAATAVYACPLERLLQVVCASEQGTRSRVPTWSHRRTWSRVLCPCGAPTPRAGRRRVSRLVTALILGDRPRAGSRRAAHCLRARLTWTGQTEGGAGPSM